MSLARWGFIFLLTTAALLAGVPKAGAQTGTRRMARFEGMATMATSEANAGVAIDLLRWSTDDEREALLSALADGEDIVELLGDAATVGYVWTAESVGYSIRYAYSVPSTGGGERIVLALSEPFGTRNPTLWKSAPPEDESYTLLEVRLDAQGHGEGRSILSTSLAYAFGMDGYDRAEPLIENLARAN